MSQEAQILSGIRVVDFSSLFAGPSIGSALASLGADVIRIESRKRLDVTRQVRRPRGTVRNDDPVDPFNTRTYHVVNHGKRSVSIDLQQEAGRALARRLIGTADVVVQAARPGAMERMGFGYQDLQTIRPDIILVTISLSGKSGPESKYGGYAPLFASLGGVTALTGYDSEMPAEWLAVTDMRVGLTATSGCLAALLKRRETGAGTWIDISGREVMTTLIGDAIVARASGISLLASGNADRSMAPHGCFRTSEQDLWLVLAIGSDQEWRIMCHVGGLHHFLDDARFADGFRRWKNRLLLDAEIQGWILAQDARVLAEDLACAGVAATLCYRMDEALSDLHLRQRDFYQAVDGGALGQVTVAALPWRFGEQSVRPPVTAGAALGASNEDILKGLIGLSDNEYDQAVRDGVIG